MLNCSDEPTSIGKGGLPDEDLIDFLTINSAEDSLSQSSSYFHKVIQLGTAERILLGKHDNVEASLLMKYQISLADSLKNDILNNSINVVSSEMEFYQTYRFGEESAQFDFTVHKINSNWSVGFSEDSIAFLSFDAEDLSGQKSVNDSITTSVISNQLILDWMRIAADTNLQDDNGVFIKPTGNTFKVLGYQALTTAFTNLPVVKVVIEKPGVYMDTLTFPSTLDVGVVEGSLPPVSVENIPLRAGYIINSTLSFILPDLHENIIVNNAELLLKLDTLETIVGSQFTNALFAHFLFDSSNTDSISSPVTLSRSEDFFVGNITGFVREWVSGNNNGLLIATASPATGVELFSIKGSNAFNITDRPLLKINYTKLK